MTKTKYETFIINGHTLATAQIHPEAQGEPVILVHGVMGSIAAWQVKPLLVALAHGPCYTLSLPGHFPAAFSPDFRQEHLTAEWMAELMAEGIRRLVGERPITLMGHSAGGFAVLNVAAHYPNIARRVVSISGFAHGRWTGALGIYQRLARMGKAGKTVFKTLYRVAGAVPGMFRNVLRVFSTDPQAQYANSAVGQVIEETMYNYQNLDLDAIIHYFSVMPDTDISSMLPNIQVPILAITGDGDPVVPPDESRKIAAQAPNAALALIRGAGHLPFVERPVEYQAALSEWLQKTH
jgi:pimeloyl-ACP methyl ester carboxylesterase